MNNCDKISELINAYADGEATEKEKELVEAHIKECVSCKQKLDFILKTKDILKATPKMPVPETLLKDFEEYRKKEEESAKKVIPFYKNYRMYASVAAIFIFAFVLKSGLWQEDKFVPDTLTQTPETKQIITAPAEDDKQTSGTQEIAPANENTKQVNSENQIANKSQNKQKAVEPPVEVEKSSDSQRTLTTRINIPSDINKDVPATDMHPVEEPTVASAEVSDTEIAAHSGGGAQEAYTMSRTMDTPVQSEVVEDVQDEAPAHAIVYVSEEDLAKAAKLLSEGDYFYAQVEQKLNDNRIPFESNFLSLDESVPHRVVVMVKE